MLSGLGDHSPGALLLLYLPLSLSPPPHTAVFSVEFWCSVRCFQCSSKPTWVYHRSSTLCRRTGRPTLASLSYGMLEYVRNMFVAFHMCRPFQVSTVPRQTTIFVFLPLPGCPSSTAASQEVGFWQPCSSCASVWLDSALSSLSWNCQCTFSPTSAVSPVLRDKTNLSEIEIPLHIHSTGLSATLCIHIAHT